MNKILEINKKGWDMIADDWFGSTSLPTYAPLMKTESDLKLFDQITDKKVLDIGCGSGHSLKYMAEHGAKELWGLDLSTSQITNAEKLLNGEGYPYHLFNSPMEENPGIPENYFDIVYSIYAFGWTVDLNKSVKRVSNYLKKGGMFVFSWDHPLLACLETSDEQLIISKSYHDVTKVNLVKGEQKMQYNKWKLSSYIDAFKSAGMYVESIIEDVDPEVFSQSYEDMNKYYSKDKSKLIPLSIIIKAIKL